MFLHQVLIMSNASLKGGIKMFILLARPMYKNINIYDKDRCNGSQNDASVLIGFGGLYIEGPTRADACLGLSDSTLALESSTTYSFQREQCTQRPAGLSWLKSTNYQLKSTPLLS
jgi:hypothetical protein